MEKPKISLDDVFKFVLDKALEEYVFCSVKNIADEIEISTSKSRELLNKLVEDGRLTIVYANPQLKVYAPKEVIQHIARVRKKPEWVKKYPLPNKKQHLDTKVKLDKALFEYERFEELLYLKTKTLEEPAMFAFKWLGFKVEPTKKGEYADFELTKDAFIAAVEVSGGNGGCPMEKIRQLSHYYTKTLEEEKREIKSLLVLFNHFHDIDLSKRKEPFAPEIRKAARRYKITLATTQQLYEKVKRIKSGEPKGRIVKEIMDGKWD
jgi:hypothetical protein